MQQSAQRIDDGRHDFDFYHVREDFVTDRGSDLRNFHPDRRVALTTTGEVFTETKSRGLEACLPAVGMRGV